MDAHQLHVDPFQPPDWRSKRAFHLIETGGRPHRWDDRDVRIYRRHLLDADKPPRERMQRDDIDWSSLAISHQIRFSPAEVELRYILEARLLTRVPFSEIARRLNVSLSTIEFFEKLFFNVCDRIECRDWIAKVIKSKPTDSDSDQQGAHARQQRALTYRWYAYHGGPLVLDALLHLTSPGYAPSQATDTTAFFDEAVLQSIRRNAALAMCDLAECGSSELLKMMKRTQRETGGKRTRKKRRSGQPDIAENIRVFLSQFESSRSS